MEPTTEFRIADTEVPTIAFALGWAGVIPFAVCTAVAIFGPGELRGFALSALVSYSAIILGFMGAVHWGLEMSQQRAAAVYIASVVPALVAFPATLLPVKFGIAVLICGFAGLLLYDLSRVRGGCAPAWYAKLRLGLSGVVIAALGLAAMFA